MAKTRKRSVNQTQAVTTGTTIRFEQPSSGRKPKPNPAVVVMQEVNPVSGFASFLREYAVVGLAVGFIVGLQAQELVKSLVGSFINPAFQLFFGEKLADRTATLHFREHAAQFGWGSFVYTLLNFLFVLAAIFIIVKVLKLDKFSKASQADIDKIKPKKA